MTPVSEGDKRRRRVEDSVDKVADTCPEVLLQEIDLKVLEKMQSVLTIDDTLHYYYIIVYSIQEN